MATVESTELQLETGTGRLAGTLTRPSPAKAAAFIVAGSGPTDRDGNGPFGRNDALKLLAEALAARGIASLRADKRGIGASAGALASEAELRIDDLAADVAAWLDRLAEALPETPRLLIGHSEGALVATLAAQKHPVRALVLIAGLGRPAVETIRTQLRAAALDPALLNEAEVILEALDAGQAVQEVPAALQALFRPSVQPYLRSWFRLDPQAELAAVAVPSLVIQGDRDLQVPLSEAELLASPRDGAELIIVEDMNHVLKAVPPDRDANLASYADPTRPLAPGLVEAIDRFVERVLAS